MNASSLADELGRSSDLSLGFKCFSVDAISLCCFGNCFDQTAACDFNAPLPIAMEQSLPSFSLRKQFGAIVWLVRNFSDSPIMSIFPSTIRSLCSLYNVRHSVNPLFTTQLTKRRQHGHIDHRYSIPKNSCRPTDTRGDASVKYLVQTSRF